MMVLMTKPIKMDEQTLTALKESIEKWEGIVADTGVDDGAENCALCDIFNSDYTFCEGCPVYNSTSQRDCAETPYYAWYDHHLYEHHRVRYPLKIKCKTCKEIAQKELEFLKSLLPSQTHGSSKSQSSLNKEVKK